MILVAVPVAAAAAGAATPSVRTSLISQQWSLGLTDGSDFRQTVLATQVHAPGLVHEAVTLDLYLPYSWTTDDPVDASISSVGDTQLRGSWRSPSRRWSVTVGMDLPTGKTPLSASEYVVASRILASRVLDFYVKRVGEGFDAMASVAHSYPIGRNTVLGVALAGFLKGEYDVAADLGLDPIVTEPGHRLHLSASLLAREHDRDPDWDLRASATLQLAGDSRLTQRDLATLDVAEGVQGTLELDHGRRIGREDRLRGFIYLLGREQTAVSGQDLPAIEILGIGTRWIAEFGASYTRPLPEIADLTLSLAHAVYQIEAADDINSNVTTIELAAARRLSDRVAVSGEAGFGFGSTPWSELADLGTWERRDLTGWSLGVSARWSW